LYQEQQRKANPIGTVEDVADHIDHVVQLVGVDYVGLGSDFDGVTALPDRKISPHTPTPPYFIPHLVHTPKRPHVTR
jgi:microsomal dipeptidase-like Zn-dependent dipeptidase